MKKQLAVLMAAATAVTTVAPVLANAEEAQVSRVDLLNKVDEALKVRYSDPSVTGGLVEGGKPVYAMGGKDYLNSVYKFAIKIDGKYVSFSGSTTNSTIAINPSSTLTKEDIIADTFLGHSKGQIIAALDYAELHGKEVTVEKYDKGHRVEGSLILEHDKNPYKNYIVGAPNIYDNFQDTIKYMFTDCLYIGKPKGDKYVDEEKGIEGFVAEAKNFVAPQYLDKVQYGKLNGAASEDMFYSLRRVYIGSVQQVRASAGNTDKREYIDVLVQNSHIDALQKAFEDKNPNVFAQLAKIDNAIVYLSQEDKTLAESVVGDVDDDSLFRFDKQLVLYLKSGVQIPINERTQGVLNFEYAIDDKGNYVDVRATSAKFNGTVMNIKAFEKVETIDGTANSYNIATVIKPVDVYDVQQYNTTFEAKNIYTQADGYSVAGAELVNNIIDAIGNPIMLGSGPISSRVLNKNAVQTNFGTKRYVIGIKDLNDVNLKHVKEGDKFVLYIPIEVMSLDDYSKAQMGLQAEAIEKKITSAVIRIEADTQFDISNIKKDILNKHHVVAGRRNVLAGADRFKTAIEISKESFADNGKSGEANAVVLVGQFALVDGLSAAPLAKKVNAPILLSKTDSIDNETIAEIKRLIGKNSAKKIYIIGGENTISKKVEEQLDKELQIRSERIEGKDRFDTSRKIALELKRQFSLLGLNEKKFDQVYVVGQDAEADAMSVSAVAARDASNKLARPIVIVPKTQLDYDSKLFLDKNLDKKAKVYLIGGVNSASEQVRKDLVAITHHNAGSAGDTDKGFVKRVAGADRQETNAAVIEEFYGTEYRKQGKKPRAEGLFVAKSDSKSLVDALAAGPLAGSKGYPIVLATSALTDSQKDAIRNHVVNYKAQNNDRGYANIFEVGMGINAQILNDIYKILGIL